MSTIRDKTAPIVRLERNLCFYYSDFFPSNFILNDTSDLCLIDFDQAGFLPPSFMSYALAESRWSPGLWIKDILKLPEHNLNAMKNIAYWFAISVSSIGKSTRLGRAFLFHNLLSKVVNNKFGIQVSSVLKPNKVALFAIKFA